MADMHRAIESQPAEIIQASHDNTVREVFLRCVGGAAARALERWCGEGWWALTRAQQVLVTWALDDFLAHLTRDQAESSFAQGVRRLREGFASLGDRMSIEEGISEELRVSVPDEAWDELPTLKAWHLPGR